jgi:hypothetical protein
VQDNKILNTRGQDLNRIWLCKPRQIPFKSYPTASQIWRFCTFQAFSPFSTMSMLSGTTTVLNTYKNIFYSHFAFSWTTFLRIWSKKGHFLFKSILKVSKHWHGRKGWECLKGAKSSNLRRSRIRFKWYLTRLAESDTKIWCIPKFYIKSIISINCEKTFKN